MPAQLTASPQVLETPRAATLTEETLTLPQQLSRPAYLEINKFLEVMQIKWDKKRKLHLLGPGSYALLQGLLETETVTDKKVAFQQFYTPPTLAQQLAELAEIEEQHTCLEPSAGKGAIVDAILRYSQKVTAVELDPENCKELHARAKLVVYQGDFLSQPLPKFDRVVMNPPFTKAQDITHVTRAFGLLNPDGVLVAVVAQGALQRKTKAGAAFAELYVQYGEQSFDLPAATFKTAGTLVNASVIKLRKLAT